MLVVVLVLLLLLLLPVVALALVVVVGFRAKLRMGLTPVDFGNNRIWEYPKDLVACISEASS